MTRNVALITGITGQDGSYLAEFLLEKGYEVHGLIRRSSTFNTSRIDHIYQDPHVESPKLYLGLLEAIRSAGIDTRFYQASTSELFGSTPPPQNEESLFKPRSPYAAAKLMAYWCTVNYREGYGMHATNGILFNHESPRRGETFVTRKITRAVAKIANGSREKLFLGNLDAIRDWGYAKEYVESMWLMLQQDKPSDYVVATGVGATVRDFAKAAFDRVGLNWENYVSFDQKYIRPTEVDALIGDPSKAIQQLGWKATTHWKELAELMVDSDLLTLKN